MLHSKNKKYNVYHARNCSGIRLQDLRVVKMNKSYHLSQQHLVLKYFHL